MKSRPPETLNELVYAADGVAVHAGPEALALLVDEKGIVADDLWRWLVKRGAGR